MSKTISVSTPLLTAISGISITPAQRAAIWELAGFLDEQRVPAENQDAVWITMPTKRLRGDGGRNDNAWLNKLLDRMMGIKFSGVYNGDHWGAVLLAEYHFEQDGSLVRLLMPPTGIKAIRSPETFAKIDQKAVHLLKPHALNLYGLLASKKWQDHKKWKVEIEELKATLGVSDKYKGRFDNFKNFVLDPAVKDVNAFGVVSVKWKAEKLGRSFHWITFEWEFKDPITAAKTDKETDKPKGQQGKPEQTSKAAPPLIPDETRAALLAVTSLIENCGLKETKEGIFINGRSPSIRGHLENLHEEMEQAIGKNIFIH